MHEAYYLFAILLITIILFIWGYWRYDIIALLALIVGLLTGVVPFSQGFSGFSNPAVITVACIMVITQAIAKSGFVDFIVKKITPATSNTTIHIAVLSVMTAFLSAFMNNVGALALMMPIAIRSAINNKRSPSIVLLPIALASALGGLTTLIGTPPNILIASFRQQATGTAFAMFAYTPVGIIVATAGIIFIILVGWRLLPSQRKAAKQPEDIFEIDDYITEIKVPEESPFIGKTVNDLEHLVEGEITIVGLIRKQRKRFMLQGEEVLEKNDILIVAAAHNDIQKLLKAGKLILAHDKPQSAEILRSKDIKLVEAVVPQGSRIEGRSAQQVRLRARHNINLLAIAREGKPFKQRLQHVKLRIGDVVLLQGEADNLHESIVSLGFLPLYERGVETFKPRSAILSIGIFIIAVILAGLQILPAQIAFVTAAVAMILVKIISVQNIYESIDWPVIVLLGAMIPLGNALKTTGATDLLVHFILSFTQTLPPIFLLGLLFIITMTLSDFMNNAATAIVMAPIAITLARSLGYHINPFLMVVAVASSCSFLTPIGHQNNTLVMGPGGYKFLDYIRIGLPLEIIIVLISVPTIIWIWPL